jgi:hypothetical protein
MDIHIQVKFPDAFWHSRYFISMAKEPPGITNTPTMAHIQFTYLHTHRHSTQTHTWHTHIKHILQQSCGTSYYHIISQ